MPDSGELMWTALLRARGPCAQQLRPACLQQPERGSRGSARCVSASGCFPDRGALPFAVCSQHGWSVRLPGLSRHSRAASPRAPSTPGGTGQMSWWWQQTLLGSWQQPSVSPAGPIPAAGTLLSCSPDRRAGCQLLLLLRHQLCRLSPRQWQQRWEGTRLPGGLRHGRGKGRVKSPLLPM